MTSQSDGSASFSLLAVDDDEFTELERLLIGHPTIHLHDLVVDDPSGRLLDRYPSHPPSASLWDRIEQEIVADTAPEVVSPLAPVVRRSQRRVRWAGAMAAVAASVIAIAGVALVLRGSEPTVEERFVASAAELMGERGTTVLELSDPASDANAASVVLAENGMAFFIFDSLETLAPDQTYQLWAVVEGNVVSAALLGASGGTQPIRLEAEPEVLAVTVETAGGVVVSEQSPVALWAAEA